MKCIIIIIISPISQLRRLRLRQVNLLVRSHTALNMVETPAVLGLGDQVTSCQQYTSTINFTPPITYKQSTFSELVLKNFSKLQSTFPTLSAQPQCLVLQAVHCPALGNIVHIDSSVSDTPWHCSVQYSAQLLLSPGTLIF